MYVMWKTPNGNHYNARIPDYWDGRPTTRFANVERTKTTRQPAKCQARKEIDYSAVAEELHGVDAVTESPTNTVPVQITHHPDDQLFGQAAVKNEIVPFVIMAEPDAVPLFNALRSTFTRFHHWAGSRLRSAVACCGLRRAR